MANLTGQLFIDGLWLEGHGDFFESLQPVTGATVWDGVSASIEDVDAAVREIVHSCTDAKHSWPSQPPNTAMLDSPTAAHVWHAVACFSSHTRLQPRGPSTST